MKSYTSLFNPSGVFVSQLCRVALKLTNHVMKLTGLNIRLAKDTTQNIYYNIEHKPIQMLPNHSNEIV